MVENLQTTETALPEGKTSGLGGILGTTAGRVTAAVLALVIVLAVAGALVYLFVLQPGAQQDGVNAQTPAGSVVTSNTAEGSEEATPTYRRVKPLSSTYVFRDIFTPTVKPVVEPSTTTSSSTTASSAADADTVKVPKNTLFLKSISTQDGKAVAKFIWNGTVYEAAKGERLGETPWRVLQINGNTVVMLYGDARVTLTVGQAMGASK